MKLASRLTTLASLALSTAASTAGAAVDFVKDIQPVLENNCVSCHRKGNVKGGVRLDTFKEATTSGDNGPALVPGKSAKSAMYTTMVLPEDDDLLMPPKKKGGPLPKATAELVRAWIDEGALWPADLVLVSKKKEETTKVDEPKLVIDIHARIVASSPAIPEKEMKAYSESIPGTGVNFDLVSIPSGKFKMGSPAGEEGRGSDEGPQRDV